MVKKKKSQHRSNRSKKRLFKQSRRKISLLKHRYWIILAVALAIIIFIRVNTFQPEDLGAQLPPPPADALYKKADQPIDARVQDLLARMTLEEKIGQMALVDKNSLKKTEDISKYYLGGILSGAGAKPADNTPQGWLDMINIMKNQALNSRLGIPIFYGVDANHGHSNLLGATVFPHAVGLGASQDAALVKEVAQATAEELTSTGVNWSFSPSLDAPKDMRWGRVYEAFSDNPQLNATLGAAYISGTQTSTGGSYVLATAKHYLATGSMVWGQSNHKKFKIDQGKTVADETALNNEYLIPYTAAVWADVSSVMIGLNQWGDQRIIDSKYLITDKLKNELGFKGFVVSDWYGVYEYSKTSNYLSNINTINAGLDMAMLPYDYSAFLKDVRKAVKAGLISQSRIDDAVARILYQKFKAGLFDAKPSATGQENIGSQKHRQLARKAVAESVVLLKNNQSLLPLPKTGQHILVAGSGADNVGRQSGAWTVEWQGVDGNWMTEGTSVLQGINQAAGSGSTVEYSVTGQFNNLSTKADIGIVVVSEKPYAEGWGDNANPTIEKADLNAITQLKQHSNKIVVIIISGRPLIITDKISSWDAVAAAWLPGSEGAGIADVLFGDRPFTGRLPLPWPASLAQLPINANGVTNDNSVVMFTRGAGL